MPTPRRAARQKLRFACFTLIELLVVIAIISVLAAILFPVFATAREKARATSCLSSQKQVGLGILQYVQDFDENYPLGFYQALDGTFSASKTPTSWPRIIQPYVKSAAIFRCPSDTSDSGNIPGTGDTPETRFPVSYAYNYFLGGNFSPTGIPGATLPQTVKDTQTVMLVDGAAMPQAGVAPANWKQKLSSTAATPATPDTKNRTAWLLVHAGTTPVINFVDYGAPMARHKGRVNLLFADGHAKSLKIESFYHVPGQAEDPRRPAGYSQWWSPCLEPAFGCEE